MKNTAYSLKNYQKTSLPVLTGIQYSQNLQKKIAELQKNNDQNQQITNYEFSLWISYWNKTYKRRNWQKISEFPYPFYTQCTSLKISNCQLESNDLKQILENQALQNLHTLDVSSNNLSLKCNALEIILNLDNLQELNLQNNKNILNFAHIQTNQNLLSNTKKLTNLKTLNIENSNLSSEGLAWFLENCVCHEKLTYLNVSKNHGISNFQAITLLKNLETLVLNYTSINLTDIQPILNEKTLKYLDISSCKFIPGLKQNLDSIKSTFVETLILQDTNLECQQIFEVLQVFNQVKKLDLENNQALAKDNFDIFLNNGQILSNIQWLSLKNCSFDKTEQHEKDELDRKYQMEQQGQVYEPFDYKFIPFQMKMIENVIQIFPNLEFIDMAYNDIHDKGLCLLLEGFKKNGNIIKHLQLGGCQLTIDSIKSIINSQELKNLESLGLRQNQISNQGVDILVNNAKFENLNYINLSACKIGDEGFENLLKWDSIKTVQDFRFSENISRISDEQYLELLVKNLNQLQKLQKITIGSGMQMDTDIPEQILERNIYISPFIGDGLD